MNKEKSVDVLNSLVVINKDRIDGYETASENTDEKELKSLFSRFAQTSHKCRQELIGEINKLGGKAEEGTKVSGKFFRAWMDVKTALAGRERKAILDSCEQGEDRAIEEYDSVFNDKDKSTHLTTDQLSIIRTQYSLIKNDQGKIRSMQNVLVEAS